MKMASELKHGISFSFYRLYLFLFFTACYTFLTFWITSTLFLFFPFAILGLIFYVFVVLFHRGVNGIVRRNEGEKQNNSFHWLILLIVILFTVGYIFAVYWMQSLMITHFGFSETSFKVVGSVLELISIGLGIFLSFFK